MLTEAENADAPLDDPKDQEARKAENKKKQEDALNANAGNSAGGPPDDGSDDGPTKNQLDKFQKQKDQHGKKSVERSQRKIQRRLSEHKEKLKDIKKSGGHSSSVEREIRNFERELKAIDKIL